MGIRAIRILPYRCLYPCKSVLIRESIFVDLGIRAIRLVVHAGFMFPLLFCWSMNHLPNDSSSIIDHHHQWSLFMRSCRCALDSTCLSEQDFTRIEYYIIGQFNKTTLSQLTTIGLTTFYDRKILNTLT